MVTLANELFPGTSGTAWPAQWTKQVSTGTVTQNGSGQGVLTTAAAINTYGDTTFLAGLTAVRDMDITLDVSFPSVTERFYVLAIRSNNSASATVAPTNCYYIQIGPQLSVNASMEFGKFVAGVQTRISSFNFGPAWAANVAQSVRFQAIGNQMQIKWWAAGAAEPATWGLTPAADSSLSAATGSVWMATFSGSTSATAVASNVAKIFLTDGTPSAVAPKRAPLRNTFIRASDL